MNHVLFLDDQPFFVRRYIEALKSRNIVEYFDRVIPALQRARTQASIRGLVLDMMMPPPDGIPESQVEEGLATGLWVLNELRTVVLERPMPVLILTYRSLDIVNAGVGALEFPPGYVDVRAKDDVRADRICDELERLIAACADAHRKRKAT